MEWKSDHGLRRLAGGVRSGPPALVAPLPGHARDRTDRCRWKRPGSVIGPGGPKYHDHIAGCGGGGAAGPVIHGLGCSPLEAINRLAGRPSVPNRDGPPCPARPGTLALPEPCEGSRDAVRACPTGERGLDDARPGKLRSAGLPWADARLNAVFACRDARGRITGAELVGVRRFADGDAKAPAGAFLAESAIDALSACALGAGGPASIRAPPAGTCRRLPDRPGDAGPAFIICGFEEGGPGGAAAGALIAPGGRVSRARPSGGEDRNALPGRGSRGDGCHCRSRGCRVTGQPACEGGGHPGTMRAPAPGDNQGDSPASIRMTGVPGGGRRQRREGVARPELHPAAPDFFLPGSAPPDVRGRSGIVLQTSDRR